MKTRATKPEGVTIREEFPTDFTTACSRVHDTSLLVLELASRGLINQEITDTELICSYLMGVTGRQIDDDNKLITPVTEAFRHLALQYCLPAISDSTSAAYCVALALPFAMADPSFLQDNTDVFKEHFLLPQTGQDIDQARTNFNHLENILKYLGVIHTPYVVRNPGQIRAELRRYLHVVHAFRGIRNK